MPIDRIAHEALNEIPTKAYLIIFGLDPPESRVQRCEKLLEEAPEISVGLHAQRG
jgi:hypothetical protein